MTVDRRAILYGRVTSERTCPYGVMARALLDQHGFEVEEHILASRAEVDAFEAEQGVSTTPRIFIDGERIDGRDALEACPVLSRRAPGGPP
jgi:glutaredoxin 3